INNALDGNEDKIEVVVQVGHLMFAIEMMGPSDLPYLGLNAPYQDEKQPLGDLGLGQIFLCDVVFTFPHGAVDDRNIVRFRIATIAATEATRNLHQMCVVQVVIGAGEFLQLDMQSP